eukprot:1774738-Pyramimonas_sp.AAC.1
MGFGLADAGEQHGVWCKDQSEKMVISGRDLRLGARADTYLLLKWTPWAPLRLDRASRHGREFLYSRC